jgi:hypothetical protein
VAVARSGGSAASPMMAINPPMALLLSEFVTLGPGDWVIENVAHSAGRLYLAPGCEHSTSPG